MTVNITSGWLDPVRRVPSPNYDARPPDVDIDLLVIHGISLPPGEFGGEWIDALFTNSLAGHAHASFADVCDMRVSAHLLINRRGNVTQYVPFHSRAWHAGESRFEGRPRCNDFSIGIELEGCDNVPYEPAQYLVLVKVIDRLMRAYSGLSPGRIVGHSDIAPDRKTDPGPAFDWRHLHSLLEAQKTII